MRVNGRFAMKDSYFLLIPPILAFVISSAIAVVVYYKTRVFWRKILDESRGARFLYVTASVVLLPLILGGWSDVIDASEVLQGKITEENCVALTLIATLLVLYIYLHSCWFDREEHSLVTRADEAGRVRELDCQKNYLVRLLENFRACIGCYSQTLKEFLAESPAAGPVLSRISPAVFQKNLRLIVEAVRQTYKSVDTVPKDYDLRILLLEAKGEYLEHCESYDGTSWDCQKRECDSHKLQYFNLSTPNCSAAVASVTSGQILIIESCEDCHRDDRHPFFYFQDSLEVQKQDLGSMISVPFDIDESKRRFVLCVTCAKAGAFLRAHDWKAKAIRENLQARIGLLYSQAAVFEAGRSELQSLLDENETLRKQNAVLEKQVKRAEGRVQALEGVSTPIDITQMESKTIEPVLASSPSPKRVDPAEMPGPVAPKKGSRRNSRR